MFQLFFVLLCGTNITQCNLCNQMKVTFSYTHFNPVLWKKIVN